MIKDIAINAINTWGVNKAVITGFFALTSFMLTAGICILVIPNKSTDILTNVEKENNNEN